MSHRFTALAALVSLLLGLAGDALAQDSIREEVDRAQPRLTRAPVLVRFVEADYPEEARRRGVAGTVELAIDVDAGGAVSRVEVLASPDPALTEAAAAAARKFRFTPAEIDGQPGPVRIRYAYNFVLDLAFEPLLPEWVLERPAAPAGSDVLTGRVREEGTRLPLPGVAVAIAELGLEVKADSQGVFGFKEVSPGKYTVTAISLEHRREMVQVEVRRGEQTRVELYLPRLAVNPYEVIVRGERRKTVVTRVTLRQQELTTVPGTFGDPIRVIESLPGVARVPYIGGALLIRGAAPGDSGVFLDGVKIPILYHFLGGPSVLHPEFLDRIDYYPGNPDVRYGRLIAGVVDVTTRSTFTRQWGGSLDINLLNSSLMLKVPLHRRVSVSGAVRRSYIDAILPHILGLTEQRATTVVPIYYDYQLRVDVDLPGDDQLFFLAFGSDDALGIASNEPERNVELELDTHTSFHRLLGRWRWQVTSRLTSTMTPAFGVDYVRFDLGDSRINLRVINGGLREDLEYRLSRRVRLRGGADIVFEQNELDTLVPVPKDYRNPGAGMLIGSGNVTPLTEELQQVYFSQWQYGIGLYGDAIVDLGQRLQVIPGARLELLRYFGNSRLSVDPRLTVRYRLREGSTLKGAAGMYSQAPEPRAVNDVFGNPNLTLEHAAHFSAGLEQRLLSALSLDAQLYYIRRWNLAVPTTALRPGSTIDPLRFSNEGNSYSYGLELILKHDVTRRFYGWIAYTLSRSMEQREAGRDYQPFVFDQTHILTLVASLRLGVGWEVGSRFRLVSGRPDTPVTGSVFDSDQSRYLRLIGERGSIRQPLFHQLDLRLEKTWLFDLWRLSAYLDVQNVYNAKNPEATLYDYRYRQSAPLRGLPILPSVGVRGSF